jgi:hypothetical protein
MNGVGSKFCLISARVCNLNAHARRLIAKRSTVDSHEIDLASAKMLPTTSLRLAIINTGTSSSSIAAATKPGALAIRHGGRRGTAIKTKTQRDGALPFRRLGA